MAQTVEGQVAANGQAEGFDGLYLFPVITPFPYFQHSVLNDILCISGIERDAECQPEEFILQRQYVVLETNHDSSFKAK